MGLERIEAEIRTVRVNRVRIIVEQSDSTTWEIESVPIDDLGVQAGSQLGRQGEDYDVSSLSLSQLHRGLSADPEFLFFMRGGEFRLRIVDEREDIR